MAMTILEAFQSLSKDYNTVRAIKFINGVKKRPMNEILENYQCIYLEPRNGYKLMRGILESDIGYENLIEQASFLNSYINNCELKNYSNKEHLEGLKECYRIIEDKVRLINDEELVMENLICLENTSVLIPINKDRNIQPYIENVFISSIDIDPSKSIMDIIKRENLSIGFLSSTNAICLIESLTNILNGHSRGTFKCNENNFKLFNGVIEAVTNKILESNNFKLYEVYSDLFSREVKGINRASCKSYHLEKYRDFMSDSRDRLLQSFNDYCSNNRDDVDASETSLNMACKNLLYRSNDVKSHPLSKYIDTGCESEDDTNIEPISESDISLINTVLTEGLNYYNALENIGYEITEEGVLSKAKEKTADVAVKTTNSIEKAGRAVSKSIHKSSIQRKRVTAAAKRIPKKIDRNVSDKVNKVIDKSRNAGKEEVDEKIIEGRKKFKLSRLIKQLIGASAVVSATLINPILGVIALMGKRAANKKLHAREKKRILHELEVELKIVEEKIEDSKGDEDKRKKYELMRTKAALEKEIDRIRFNLRPDK